MNRMGKEMFADEDTSLLIDPKSSHCPHSTTTVRSQTNVTHAVSVSTASREILSSSQLICATSTPLPQQHRTSATFPQRRTN